MSKAIDLVGGEFFRTLKVQRRARIPFLSDYRDFLEIVGCHFTKNTRKNASISTSFFQNVLQDFVDSRAEYKDESIDITHSILDHLPEWMMDPTASPFIRYFYEVTDNFKADLAEWIRDTFFRQTFDEISDFMRDKGWHVHTVSFERQTLFIEQHEDFRIHYFNTYVLRGKNARRP